MFLNVGEKYTSFVDPDTGIYYRPIDGWEIVGDEDLLSMFILVDVG